MLYLLHIHHYIQPNKLKEISLGSILFIDNFKSKGSITTVLESSSLSLMYHGLDQGLNQHFFCLVLSTQGNSKTQIQIQIQIQILYLQWKCTQLSSSFTGTPLFETNLTGYQNPNWQEANQLAIYKCSRGVEPWTTQNKSSQWSERDLNLGSP